MLKRHTIRTVASIPKLLILGWGSFAAIGIGIVGYSSIVPENTNAALQIKASISQTDYFLDLSSSASSVSMNISPSATDKVTAANDQIGVKTNIPTGYKLYISATSPGTVKNSLYNTYTPPEKETPTIPSTSAAASSATLLSSNQWGYGIPKNTEGLLTNNFSTNYSTPNSANWAGVPTTSDHPVQTIDHANDALGGNQVSVYYGINTNSRLSSGTYTGNIIYTAIANIPEPPTPTWDNITDMQQMTPEICASQPTPAASATTVPTRTLKDTRDGKTYTISKLADGNCWMTQNLDLNLSSSTPLTPDNSDVTSSWTPQTTYTATSQWTSTSSDSLASIDMGDYYYDGSTYSSSQSGTTYAGMTGFNTTGNQHYHVGNLYSWNTATANSRASSAGAGNATDSICPKGWRLPTGSSSGEFKALVNAYSAGSTVQTLINEPVYMVRGGLVYSGQLRYAANYGAYWSSMANSSSNGYEFVFSSTSGVYPASSDARYGGISLRCIAR